MLAILLIHNKHTVGPLGFEESHKIYLRFLENLKFTLSTVSSVRK